MSALPAHHSQYSLTVTPRLSIGGWTIFTAVILIVIGLILAIAVPMPDWAEDWLRSFGIAGLVVGVTLWAEQVAYRRQRALLAEAAALRTDMVAMRSDLRQMAAAVELGMRGASERAYADGFVDGASDGAGGNVRTLPSSRPPYPTP